MMRILFVCHGNICRSPMAEFIMKDIVKKKGLSERFEISSAATSTEEIGSFVYPPARKILAENKISCSGKTARQISLKDYSYYDMIIGMDKYNIKNMMRFFGDDPYSKIYMLLDFTDKKGDVDDPWYTDDFKTAYNDILYGCNALFEYLNTNKKI